MPLERTPQERASAARIPRGLFGSGPDRLLREDVRDAALVQPPHEVLDHAVFARVEADHPETAAGREHVPRDGKRALEHAVLVVDRDPERLEHPRRGMDVAAAAEPGRNQAGNEAGQVAGGPERPGPAALDARAGDLPRD